MPIRIHNIRLGLATNSSSTHSIVFFSKGHNTPDHDVGGYFGRDQFTAASKRAKQDYLAIVLHDALRGECGQDIADAVTKAWVGVSRPADGEIDYQSQINLPRGWNGKGIDKQFVDEFTNFLMREEIVILGGSDEDDESHPLLGAGTDMKVRRAMPIEERTDYVAKKDPSGFWTLFSRSTGAKLRLTFDTDTSMVAEPTHSASPELVDLKITDWCDTGCRYCYQGSTTKGKHADDHVFYALASTLAEMRVFEVAIGGGEPTSHPKFSEILGWFRRAGIVPNFTTKSTAWMRDKVKCDRILENCGAFAFSVETAEELRELLKVCLEVGIKPKNNHYTDTGLGRSKMIIQHVMGTDPSQEKFEELLKTCADIHLPITLLGYKSIGRGKSLMASKHDWWIDTVKRMQKTHWMEIGIDTALASQYQEQIEAAGINKKLFGVSEGAFSMYIDAVKGTVGPSSYHENVMRKSEFTSNAILEHYNSLAFAVMGNK